MSDAVLRDLVDCVLGEQLAPVEVGDAVPGRPGERWCRVGDLRVRLRPGGALQPWRCAGGPALDRAGAAVGPADAVTALGLAGPAVDQLVEDLTTAVAHDAVVHSAVNLSAVNLGAATPPSSDRLDLRAGERLAVTRGRPFHPTGRAVTGWSAEELATYGPSRRDPLGVAWIAVRRDHLRLGPDPASGRLHELLGDGVPGDLPDDALLGDRADGDGHQLLPVHPWQAEHVLPRVFAAEYAERAIVPVARDRGRFHPTASLRTLLRDDVPERHLKLPLGVATLGAARLLPPRYLDNADRAERTMRAVVDADPTLAGMVGVCAEGTWAGWADPSGDDEFAGRPGHLAAQVRTYPPGSLDGFALPMAALAADAWGFLGPGLGVDDPVAFFGGLADAFVAVALAFLGHGVLPELHGQNVVVRLAPGGAVDGFVLRDHDTLRLHPAWMAAAGVADPGYRIAPGARQSLRLDTGRELVGYLQTLGLQVNLYGIVDALARHHDLDETLLWARLRVAVERALSTVALRPEVGAVVADALLVAPRWPSRTVLGPLLARGRSTGVSMPAATGSVPNPLRPA